jgi:hypothetical protein
MQLLSCNISQWLTLIFVAIVLIGCVPVIIYLARKNTRKARKEFEELAASLGGEISGSEIRLTSYDPELRLWFAVGFLEGGPSEGVPSIVLSYPLAVDFDFEISKENSVTKTLQGMGLNLDSQTGSQLLDEKYFIKSSRSDRSGAFLLAGPRRELVDYFFDNGFTKISLDRGNLYMEKAGYAREDLTPEKMRQYAAKLKNFVKG